MDFIDHLRTLRDANTPYAVATVVDVEGSSSAKTGSKAIIDADGQVLTGWVGGGCAESTACHAALEALDSGQTTIIDIDLDDEVLGVGMPCGGSMRVYVEPVQRQRCVWIMGHGEVAEHLCRFANALGHRVIVNDPMASEAKFPDAHERITDDLDYEKLDPHESDFVVIATQHKGDHESMTRALASGAGLISLIASRKRAGLVMDYLREQGFDDQALARVMAPCGLDLGGRVPAEIALSVVSEITLHLRGGSGRRMRELLGEPTDG
ncbi:MAG: XdhC family protein [Pseudomonadota bacterium]